ncbi:Rieske [2Fe-2S] iron-sulfur domain-containing protein [Aspergillus cavernicola]|uniref:Rieske [2Fe-2S] iron-sulfur domain-containing protein n=1 Tax=Aspergillus cavernicola TaxID=176166 RepID=A0ABR4IMR3_9EURO
MHLQSLISFPLLLAFLSGLAFLYRLCLNQLLPSTSTTKRHHNANTLQSGPSTTSPIPILVSKESPFPPDWLTGKPIFELERRAIFSKTWIPLLHLTRFQKTPGTYQTLTIATTPIFLVLGKDLTLRAFHNVCRHRAYPVVSRKESGVAMVLGCRYHGWSYNTVGELVKAPFFLDKEGKRVGGFEKGENGLFAIRVWVSGRGFVFGNLGVEKGRGVGMGMRGDEEDVQIEVGPLDGFAERNGIGIGRGGGWIAGGVVEGRFNWKIACINKVRKQLLRDQESPPPSLLQRTLHYFQQHQPPDSFHIFPNTFIYTIPSSGYWISLSFRPSSEKTTSIRYNVYSYRDLKSAVSQAIMAGLKEKFTDVVAELERVYRSLTTSTTGLGISR